MEKVMTPREAFAHFMEVTIHELIPHKKGNSTYLHAKRLERALAGKAKDWNADDESIEKFLTSVAPERYEFRRHVEVVVKD